MADTKRYVDTAGLQLYHDLSVTEMTTIADEGDKIVWDAVEKKFRDALDGVIINKPVYYRLDPDGEKIPKYIFQEAGSVATQDAVYYEKIGTGTADDPYRYRVKDPQPVAGADVSGLYILDGFETTTSPTEEEKEHPVVDAEGNPVLAPSVYIDQSTIINVMSSNTGATIPDEDIESLFKEE